MFIFFYSLSKWYTHDNEVKFQQDDVTTHMSEKSEWFKKTLGFQLILTVFGLYIILI